MPRLLQQQQCPLSPIRPRVNISMVSLQVMYHPVSEKCHCSSSSWNFLPNSAAATSQFHDPALHCCLFGVCTFSPTSLLWFTRTTQRHANWLIVSVHSNLCSQMTKEPKENYQTCVREHEVHGNKERSNGTNVIAPW